MNASNVGFPIALIPGTSLLGLLYRDEEDEEDQEEKARNVGFSHPLNPLHP